METEAVLALVEAAVTAHFEQQPVRASISFLGVDPVNVLRFEPLADEVVYVSLGMSRRSMAASDAFTADPGDPRAELLLHVRRGSPGAADAWRSLAVLASAPAVEGVVYAAGMTVDLGQPFGTGSSCSGAVVTGSVVDAVELGAAEPSAAAVQVLQLLPATATELAWARVHGTQALQTLWVEAGCDLLDLGRRAVTLPATPS